MDHIPSKPTADLSTFVLSEIFLKPGPYAKNAPPPNVDFGFDQGKHPPPPKHKSMTWRSPSGWILHGSHPFGTHRRSLQRCPCRRRCTHHTPGRRTGRPGGSCRRSTVVLGEPNRGWDTSNRGCDTSNRGCDTAELGELAVRTMNGENRGPPQLVRDTRADSHRSAYALENVRGTAYAKNKLETEKCQRGPNPNAQKQFLFPVLYLRLCPMIHRRRLLRSGTRTAIKSSRVPLCRTPCRSTRNQAASPGRCRSRSAKDIDSEREAAKRRRSRENRSNARERQVNCGCTNVQAFVPGGGCSQHITTWCVSGLSAKES